MLHKTNFLVLEKMQKYKQEVCPPIDILLDSFMRIKIVREVYSSHNFLHFKTYLLRYFD